MKNNNIPQYDKATMIDACEAWNYAHSRRDEVKYTDSVRVSMYTKEDYVPYVYKMTINGDFLPVLDSFKAWDENTEYRKEHAKKYGLPYINVYRHVFNREDFYALFKDYPKKG